MKQAGHKESSAGEDAAVAGFLADVGGRIRQAREQQGLSRRALSVQSGVSQRYLAQLETGGGNISIGLLFRLSVALDRSIGTFVAAQPGKNARGRRICLIGLRGAGKSTLGPLLGDKLGLPFRELNSAIENLGGMEVGDIMALYGPDGYRRLERRALERVLKEEDGLVLAVAGGIVLAPETYDFLLDHFHTIWLQASPHEHMARVRAQGDHRPMAGNRHAMKELKALLTNRQKHYEKAAARISTSGAAVSESLDALCYTVIKLGIEPEA